MHILSTFPSLLTFGLLAPMLLRLTVGCILLRFGRTLWLRLKLPYRYSVFLYYIFGVFLIIGLYTQIVALGSIALVAWDYYIDRELGKHTTEEKMCYIMIVMILISLLFTGPGFFAIDLPL